MLANEFWTESVAPPIKESDLVLNEEDALFSQKSSETPQKIQTADEKRKETHTGPREISSYLTRLYWDDTPANNMFQAFTMPMKIFIERAYLLRPDRNLPTEKGVKDYIVKCMEDGTYPELEKFDHLFNDPYISVSNFH